MMKSLWDFPVRVKPPAATGASTAGAIRVKDFCIWIRHLTLTLSPFEAEREKRSRGLCGSRSPHLCSSVSIRG
jgi:hypothetical protein